MNLFNIIEEIEKVDPEFGDRINPRRDAIKNMTSFGTKVAVAALPFALGSLFKRAYGATTAATMSVTDVLNYALTLEHLEAAFYVQGVQSGVVASGDAGYITTIRDDENQHVSFLTTVITSLNATPVAAGKYDFTAKGTFPTVFTSYDTFLAVAQAFEDTGVRAYKGQAGNLLGNQTVLTAALSIHSVEARHASAIRLLRRQRGATTTKPWITGSATVSNDTGISAVDGNYAGENNVTQGGVNITTLKSSTGAGISYSAACESFDEPLDATTVVNLVTPFIVS